MSLGGWSVVSILLSGLCSRLAEGRRPGSLGGGGEPVTSSIRGGDGDDEW